MVCPIVVYAVNQSPAHDDSELLSGNASTAQSGLQTPVKTRSKSSSLEKMKKYSVLCTPYSISAFNDLRASAQASKGKAEIPTRRIVNSEWRTANHSLIADNLFRNL